MDLCGRQSVIVFMFGKITMMKSTVEVDCATDGLVAADGRCTGAELDRHFKAAARQSAGSFPPQN